MRRLAKSKNGHISDPHEIWYGDAYWPPLTVPAVEFPTFKNLRWLTAAILTTGKRR